MTYKNQRSNEVLFISDSSITNPILYSQGIPLLNELFARGYKPSILTFELDRRKYKNSLKTNADLLKNIKIDYLMISQIPRISAFITYLIKGFIKSFFLVLCGKITIIHCRSYFPAVIGYMINKILRNRVQYIYDTRGIFVHEMVYKNLIAENGTKYKVLNFIEKHVIRNAAKVIVVSNKHKCFLLDNSNCYSILDDKKIAVITNKTEIIQKSYDKRRTRDKYLAVYSGSAAKWQGIDLLADFIRFSLRKFPNIRIEILSYEEEAVRDKLVSFQISPENIQILNISKDKVQQELKKYDFGILLRENNLVNQVASPLKFGEYLAAGLPVLVSKNIGDTEEIIKKYNVGVVADENNIENSIHKMLDLIEDENITLNCLNAAEKEFNVKDSFKQYFDIYNEILAI